VTKGKWIDHERRSKWAMREKKKETPGPGHKKKKKKNKEKETSFSKPQKPPGTNDRWGGGKKKKKKDKRGNGTKDGALGECRGGLASLNNV